jgi:hypothetical protein
MKHRLAFLVGLPIGALVAYLMPMHPVMVGSAMGAIVLVGWLLATCWDKHPAQR